MHTIAAISTPSGNGGLGVIRISGECAVLIADKVFRSKNGVTLKEKDGYTAVYGNVYDNKGDIDDCVALVFRAPHSYTGEDVVELSLHGGQYVLTRALTAVLENGAVVADKGEFTRRAFLNGKMSLTAAESVMDTIHAQNEQAMRAALGMREGALYKEIQKIKGDLVELESHVAAFIDFPEEDVEEVEFENAREVIKTALSKVESLCKNFEKGKIIREGVTTAIVGKPNVGKSTLMNRLSGFEKSIVTSVAGTTRDVVEETVRVGDTVLLLLDTAGIHLTDDEVEKIGVEKAKDSINRADLILAVFDYSTPLSQDDCDLILKIKDKTVVAVVNKTDLEEKCDTDFIKQNLQTVLFLSLKTDDDIAELENAINCALNIQNFDPSAAVLSNLRQLECAKNCHKNLTDALTTVEAGLTLDMVGVCLQSAIEDLAALTGESVSDAVIDKVFSNFCVGK